MARPAPAFPPADAVRALIGAEGRLAVRVTPGAKVEALEIDQGRLLARVRARPQDGAANLAVRDLIARALDLAPTRIDLLRGATSREKMFAING